MKYLLAILLASLPALALAQDWTVDHGNSTLGFAGTYEGDPFRGVFKTFDAKIAYDPADLANARFDVSVDLASVDTSSAERDDTLKGGDFFDLEHTPKAHFVTTAFAVDANGAVTAQGTLDLHGITHPVTLAVEFTPDGKRATLTVHAILQRADWKLGAGDDWSGISAEIQVDARLALSAN